MTRKVTQLLTTLVMIPIVGSILLAAAALEVCGDDKIRAGFKDSKYSFIPLGFLMLGCYGLAVNTVNLAFKWVFHSEEWSLSKLLGLYVGFFALFSVLWDYRGSHQWDYQRMFQEIPVSIKIGLAFIFIGGLVIQWGQTMWRLLLNVADKL